MSFYPSRDARPASGSAETFFIMVTDSVKGANRPVRAQEYKTVSEYLTRNGHNPDNIKWFVDRSGNDVPAGFNINSPLVTGDHLYISLGSVKSGR